MLERWQGGGRQGGGKEGGREGGRGEGGEGEGRMKGGRWNEEGGIDTMCPSIHQPTHAHVAVMLEQCLPIATVVSVCAHRKLVYIWKGLVL